MKQGISALSFARQFAVVALSLGAVNGISVAADKLPGVSNFHQVTPSIYRGGQPTQEGFKNLAKLGVKTVIDLRIEGDRSVEKKQVEALGMKYVGVPMHGLSAPSDEDVAKVLALFEASGAGPVFVHCRQGMDRTGTVVACYRISHDKWDCDKALKEAKGFGLHWVEFAMKGYVKRYKAAATQVAKTDAPASAPVTAPPAALAVTP